MIPRHRPAFGPGRVLLEFLRCAVPVRVEDVEECFCEAFAISQAVLVPSVRAGIRWVLREVAAPGGPVFCPAFTCQVVHEAVVRAGRELGLVDNADGSLLMATWAIEAALGAGAPVVLCEVFGHTYDLASLPKAAGDGVRIVDMAMTVPDRDLTARLAERDVGMLSFGIGKCVYSGWGGMCFTRSPELACALRRWRDREVGRSKTTLLLRRAGQILARTAAHGSWLYGPLRRRQDARARVRPNEPPKSGGELIQSWRRGEHSSAEWSDPSTAIDRRLTLWNIRSAESNRLRRRSLAERYRVGLAEVQGVRLPAESAGAMSHFTIRVDSAIRRTLVRMLWQRGIDVATFFPFPCYASAASCPHAARAAEEVVNLPLSPNLTFHDIDYICESLTAAIASPR